MNSAPGRQPNMMPPRTSNGYPTTIALIGRSSPVGELLMGATSASPRINLKLILHAFFIFQPTCLTVLPFSSRSVAKRNGTKVRLHRLVRLLRILTESHNLFGTLKHLSPTYSLSEAMTPNDTSVSLRLLPFNSIRPVAWSAIVLLFLWTAGATWVLLHSRAMGFGLETIAETLVEAMILAVIPTTLIGLVSKPVKYMYWTYASQIIIPIIFVNAYFLPEELRYIAAIEELEVNSNVISNYSVDRDEPFEWCSLQHDERGFWTLD